MHGSIISIVLVGRAGDRAVVGLWGGYDSAAVGEWVIVMAPA